LYQKGHNNFGGVVNYATKLLPGAIIDDLVKSEFSPPPDPLPSRERGYD
jgi:hypothetical protein